MNPLVIIGIAVVGVVLLIAWLAKRKTKITVATPTGAAEAVADQIAATVPEASVTVISPTEVEVVTTSPPKAIEAIAQATEATAHITAIEKAVEAYIPPVPEWRPDTSVIREPVTFIEKKPSVFGYYYHYRGTITGKHYEYRDVVKLWMVRLPQEQIDRRLLGDLSPAIGLPEVYPYSGTMRLEHYYLGWEI